MLEVIQTLSERELTNIASALRTGRLCDPFSPLLLKPFCNQANLAPVGTLLAKMNAEGLKPQHMALVFESAAMTHQRLADTREKLELVWTGPNAGNSHERDTGVVVRELFSTAQRDVLIACFAIYQGESLFQILAERMDSNPDLRVRMFLNIQRGWSDTAESSELVRRYAADFKAKHWSGKRLPEIFYDPRALSTDTKQRANLHAKSVVIDGQTSFVSSANLTEAAQLRNIELGVVIQSKSIATKICEYFDAMLHVGALLPLPIIQV